MAGPTAVTQVLPLSQLFVLEMGGVPPNDTVLTFRTGKTRRVILRQAPPDNTVFVELIFNAESFAAPGTPDSVTVSVHPRPGVYGVDVAMTVVPGPGAFVRFRYPVHFAAPVAAVAHYGSGVRVEQALSVATRLPNGDYGLLPSDRPASDNLEAPMSGTGTYLVVAPRD